MLSQNCCRNISPHAAFGNRLCRWMLSSLIKFLFRVEVMGEQNIPNGNYIVLANHLSWIDPFVLITVLPAEPRVYLIGAAQAINRRWKEWAANCFDFVILFERGAKWVGKHVFTRPLQVLEKGAVLAFFPEGDAFPYEGQLMPLQRGIGHFVLQADYPILPITLSGVRELYWQKEITVTIGKPFHVNVQGLNHRAAIDAAVEQVTDELKAILPSYVEPTVRQKRLRFLTNPLG